MKFTYKVNENGEATITGYTGRPGKNIVIPPIVNECPVTSIGESAFFHCTSLKNISIPNSVTSIGGSAFNGCTSLESDLNNYKAFNLSDGELFCRDYEFFEGVWSEELDNIQLCQRGYHFCTNLFEIFNYYSGKLDEKIAIYECEVGDKVITSDTSKCATNTIKPVKRLSRTEILKLLNV